MDVEVVTEEQCKTILVRYLKQLKLEEKDSLESETQDSNDRKTSEEEKEYVALTSFRSQQINNQCDGMIGEQFFLTVNYQQNEKQELANFFVKILSQRNPIMYEIANEIRAFDKESFFYDKYVPYLREEGFACDYVSKSYFCESDIIVLENLGYSSYKSFGKNVSLDMEHCKKCLETLATFHADSILFELKKSKELAWEYKLEEAFPETFEHQTHRGQNLLILDYYSYVIKGLRKLIELLPEDSIKSVEFSKVFREVLHTLPAAHLQANKVYRNVVTHNDLWCGNILYKYEEVDGVKKIATCKLVDFQSISLKPPIMDVLGFIYLNTRKSFRDIYMVDLLWHYLCCFYENLEQAGYNVQEILSFKEFRNSFENLRVICKIHCIIDRSSTLIPDQLYAEHSKSKETFSTFMFEGRPDLMCELFKNNELYREIMTEELCELRTLLFA